MPTKKPPVPSTPIRPASDKHGAERFRSVAGRLGMNGWGCLVGVIGFGVIGWGTGAVGTRRVPATFGHEALRLRCGGGCARFLSAFVFSLLSTISGLFLRPDVADASDAGADVTAERTYQ